MKNKIHAFLHCFVPLSDQISRYFNNISTFPTVNLINQFIFDDFFRIQQNSKTVFFLNLSRLSMQFCTRNVLRRNVKPGYVCNKSWTPKSNDELKLKTHLRLLVLHLIHYACYPVSWIFFGGFFCGFNLVLLSLPVCIQNCRFLSLFYSLEWKLTKIYSFIEN